MLSKIKKAIKEPKKIYPYLLFLLRKSQVKRIKKEGKICYEFEGILYPHYLDKGNAMTFILDKARFYCRGKGIDIGASRWPFPGAIPVENEEHQNAYKLDGFPDGSLDYVFSSHCLEHLERWQDALKLWIRKLRNSGILFLYLPHESMGLWLPGGPWAGYHHKWIPTYEIIKKFLEENNMAIIDYNAHKDKYWSFHIVAEKTK